MRGMSSKLVITVGRNLPLKTFTVTHTKGSSTLTGKFVIELPRLQGTCSLQSQSASSVAMLQPGKCEPKDDN